MKTQSDTQQADIKWPKDYKKVMPQTKNSKPSFPVKVSVSHPLSGVRILVSLQNAVKEQLGWDKGDKISAFKSETDAHVFYQLTKRADGPFTFSKLKNTARVILCGLPEDGAKAAESGEATYKIDGKILTLRLEKGENPVKKMTEGRKLNAAPAKPKTNNQQGKTPPPKAGSTPGNAAPIIWGESEDRMVKLAHGSGKYDQAAIQINRGRGSSARQVTGEEVKRRAFALQMTAKA